MPIDVLNEEVKGLTDEQIESVVVFVRGLKDKKDEPKKKGFPIPPGYYADHLKYIADDFDTCIPEGFEEYM